MEAVLMVCGIITGASVVTVVIIYLAAKRAVESAERGELHALQRAKDSETRYHETKGELRVAHERADKAEKALAMMQAQQASQAMPAAQGKSVSKSKADPIDPEKELEMDRKYLRLKSQIKKTGKLF